MGAPQNFVSVSRRPPDIEDYIDMVRRYRSWIVGPMFAGLVVSVVVAFLWPDTYVSTAVMRITPQQVPQNLVPSAITTQMQERLQQMETDILSRSSLSEIIQKPSLNLYSKERTRVPMEDIVQDMRNKDIKIVPIVDISAVGGGEPQNRFASAFQIQFSYTDRYKAQAVVRELVTRFTEQNVQVERSQASLTTSFLNDELKASKDKMDGLDQQITKFRLENAGRLPEQAAANAQALNMLQMNLMNINASIGRDQQDKLMLETSLQNARNNANYAAQNLEETRDGPASVKNQQLLDLDKQITEAKTTLAMVQKLYGDAYPEVSQRKAAIAVLQQEKDDVMKTEAAKPVEKTSSVKATNPLMAQAIQQYKNEEASTTAALTAKQMELDDLMKQRAEVERQVSVYQKRLEEAPVGEQQYAALLRDYNLAKQDYEDMMKKRDIAETGQNLEEHKAGENLEVLDPASLPEQPSEPNRLAWSGIGTVAGLVLGIMLAAGKEVKNTSLKNLKDVRAYTNLPVLSSIPLLENALLVRRKRRLVWLAWSSAIIIGCILMSGSMYYHLSGV